jgi:hypothetical protein
MAGVYGYQGQLAIDAGATPTLRYDFQNESLICDENFIDTNGLRGTRARASERIRQGNRRVHGQLKLIPTTQELAQLLPWILGTAVSGTTYALADTVPTRYVTIDRVSKVFAYNGCVVDRATFHGTQGGALELILDLVGVDETITNSGTFGSLSLDLSTPPLIFTDLSLSVNSATDQCKEFTLVVDNDIDKERFFNSPTLTSGYPRDRHITITHPVPYGDSSASYATGVAGVAVTATFTDSAHVLTFTFANVKYPRRSPTVPGREEIMLPLVGQCYKSGSTLELVTTLAI